MTVIWDNLNQVGLASSGWETFCRGLRVSSRTSHEYIGMWWIIIVVFVGLEHAEGQRSWPERPPLHAGGAALGFPRPSSQEQQSSPLPQPHTGTHKLSGATFGFCRTESQTPRLSELGGDLWRSHIWSCPLLQQGHQSKVPTKPSPLRT